MLTTNLNQTIGFTATDGTVYVTPGAVQVGNYVMNYKGGILPFSEMTNFDSSTNTYQTSVLSIINFQHFPDLTANYSTPTSVEANLGSFYITDTTNTKPLGFFTFYYDGSNINLKSSSKVF